MRRLFFALTVSISGFAGLAYAAMSNTELSVGATVLESSGSAKAPLAQPQDVSGHAYMTQDASGQSSAKPQTPPPQGWYQYNDTPAPPGK